MTMRVAPAPFKFRDRSDRQIHLLRGILRHVAALSGVRPAAISTDIPLLGNPIYIARFEGRPPMLCAQARLRC
jgi:hypothetical protein